MIISASRRTDIPALFADWFFHRLREGFVLLRNPFNLRQIGRIDLSPEKIDGFVFWTKNAVPMLPRLNELTDYQYYFLYTITPYGRDVERNIPDKKAAIIPSFQQIDANKAIWRYDPIFISEKYTYKYHIRAFSKIAAALENYTKKAIISFVDSYRGVDLRPLKIKPLAPQEQLELAAQLAEIAVAHGITLTACAENLNLPYACCIDGRMFGVEKPPDKNQRELCRCTESVDIGAYATCSNGCIYCYANHYGHIQPPTDKFAPILGRPLNGDEKIKQRN